MAYGISFIQGIDHKKRGVVFLMSDKDRWVNAGDYYDSADEIEQRNLQSRIKYWQDELRRKKHYHGWDKSQHKGKAKNCFVFKLESNRYYGFLCHPDKDNPQYILCVLVRLVEKRQWKTEPSVLTQIHRISEDPDVLGAINAAFE